MPGRRVDFGDIDDLEQPLPVEVVAGMTSQDALGEYGGGHDEVLGLIAKQR